MTRHISQLNRRVALTAILGIGAALMSQSASIADDVPTFRLGVVPGTPTGPKIVEFVSQTLAGKYHIIVEAVPIADPIQINIATDDKQLDGSVFQHRGFLAAQVAARGLKLTHVAPVANTIISLYSKKYDTGAALPDGATVLIPNDPANGSVAYELLAKWGAITLKPGLQPGTVTAKDIVENPKNVVFKTATASNIARAFEDVDVAVTSEQLWRGAQVNVKYRRIAEAGDPTTYAAGLVIHTDNINDPNYQKLIAAFRDPAIGAFVEEHFSEFASSIPQDIVNSWEPKLSQ